MSLEEVTIKANTLVWVRLNRNRKLGIVVAMRKHSLVVRMYDIKTNTFASHSELISLRVIEQAEITAEDYLKIACGKKILKKNTALQVVAINFVFTDVEKRKERRVYYCVKCQGFHTTSMRWLPEEIRLKLHKYPFKDYLDRTGNTEKYTGSLSCWQTGLHRWMRDDIGLKIGKETFLKTLRQYNDDDIQAIKMLVNAPAQYIEFVLYEFMRYKNDHNDLYKIYV